MNARWIILILCECVAITVAQGQKLSSVNPTGSGSVGFMQVPFELSGILFFNYLADERGLTNQIYYNASGLACGDVDGDGRVDIFFCSLNGDNRLYRNLGAWKFQDVTGSSEIRCRNQPSTGALLADVDGDGDLDLFVSGLGAGVRLFVNDGIGIFKEATTDAGLSSTASSMTMTLADIDGDGDLDLYVANYRRDTFQDEVNVRFRVRNIDGTPQILAVNDRPTSAADLTNRYYVDSRGTVHENAEPDTLYLNDGSGRFTPVSWTGGQFLDVKGRPLASAPLDWGLSAMFRDINADGAPDLYVCNDGESPDRIWLNDGHGKFRELHPLVLRDTSFSSMGIDFADINRDGHDDFFVADMLGRDHASRHALMATRVAPIPPAEFATRSSLPRNTLFLNRGDNTFAEIAQLAGVEASDWSWCPVFIDVDLDGYEDLLLTTGLERSLRNGDHRMAIENLRRQGKLSQQEFLEARRRMKRLDVPNFAFRNRGDLTFDDASATWHFDSHASSHGIALADLDNDGDQDVVVNCLNAPPLLYRNEALAPRVAVRLKGKSPNTSGIGARIVVRGGRVTQAQEVISGGRYLSCDEALRVFAAGALTNVLTVEVRWRSGLVNVISNVAANAILEVSESSAGKPSVNSNSPQHTLFVDVSSGLNNRHDGRDVDDFVKQPTLPRHVFDAGPGVAWTDRGGWDGLVVTSNGSSHVNLLTNASLHFSPAARISMGGSEPMGFLSWKSEREAQYFVLASSDLRSGTTTVSVSTNVGSEIAPPLRVASFNSVLSALAAADVDGDGDLDLFVAGRSAPGKYPRGAASKLIRNDGGKFLFDESTAKTFEDIGVINGAVFTDVDGDGAQELVLSCEWGSIRVFRFGAGGVATELTKQLGFEQWRGMWQGVTAGDFDEDGRMDLIVANWGRNHRYARFAAQPVRIYFGDADGDGTMECFESYYEPALRKYVPQPHWDAMAFRFPFLQQRVRSYSDFSTKSVEELFGERLTDFQQRAVDTFDSMVFLNRGDRFEAVALPLEAQFAPAFGVCVADFDGDGHEDAFLAQNFSGTDAETSRLNAGRGLLLLGDGTGHFRATKAEESGILVYGDGRGAAVADVDHDGRADLCVGQHAAETKLFHNQGARPGLRVRLNGRAGNANGVGAKLQTMFADGSFGPLREIHAGGGWLSQDSIVPVLATPRPIKAVKVRWPGGGETVKAVEPNVSELMIDFAARESR